MQQHRSPATPRIRRLSITAAQLLGAAAAAALTAGVASAESLSRGDVSPGGARPGNSNTVGPNPIGRDHTGMHAIDPFGYMHNERNSLSQSQHDNALRDYRAPQPVTPRGLADGNANTTWTPTDSADGAGWAVCRPQASWC